MKLPDFTGIGTRRCASSWLHEVLNSHADIGKPRRGLHFFSDNYDKGANWYLDELSCYSTKKILIEYSVTYLYPENVDNCALRLKKINPYTKLFVVVRNPVLRAYSDYLRSIRMGEIKKDIPFVESLKDNPSFLERSNYKKLLAPYYNLYNEHSIKILLYEDIVENQSKFLKDLFKFLELDFEEKNLAKRFEYAGKSIKFIWLNNFINYTNIIVSKFLYKLNLDKPFSYFKKKYIKVYLKVLEFTLIKKEINPNDFNSLLKMFTDDIDFIESKLNRNLDIWRKLN